MLSKLLKYDLRRNMRWLWILFVSVIVVASLTKGCKELGKTIGLFRVLGIFFDSVYYALAVNVILQPFLRSFMNFTKSFYNDESYLTHTLPVTKNQLINSKFITMLIEVVLGFVCLVVSLLIMFASPTMFDTLKLLLSTMISGEFSAVVVVLLFVFLVLVEFLMFISIIFFSIIIAYREKEKRLLKTFIVAAAMSFIALFILGTVLIAVLAINGVDISSSAIVLSGNAFMSIILTGIIVYIMASVVFYFLAKHEFNKGVNVD